MLAAQISLLQYLDMLYFLSINHSAINREWVLTTNGHSSNNEKTVSFTVQLVPEPFGFRIDMKVSSLDSKSVGSCNRLMDVNKGKEVHAVVNKMGYANVVSVANAKIDLYCKCGSVCYARRVFDGTAEREVASWTSMICDYCNVGKTEQALVLFEMMKLRGLEPNYFTWNAVIAGFARCVDGNGNVIGVKASKEHYACVVDLLCRSGKMVEAYEVVKSMPLEITKSIIGAFFNGCEVHGRRDLAIKLAEDIMKMSSKRPGGLVTLQNIHAAHEAWRLRM
ncbi:hypothetical protein FNV43_RR03022 [Rhamnella rubrinervis]|uniref:Pentatricopeptide repeat-containing protein n=1 Tax=Rhamnella rubrinervis TaxID=2594499 RepID=A0A8K0HI35_9ROSA|nr:hypothetical protein FNV43_RR03022 [Rhamnella rubrinervis]